MLYYCYFIIIYGLYMKWFHIRNSHLLMIWRIMSNVLKIIQMLLSIICILIFLNRPGTSVEILNKSKYSVYLGFIVFWRWCIAKRITVFLDFFLRPVFFEVETRHFGNWICFRRQVKGERRHIISWVPLKELISVPVPRMCVLYHNFYCRPSCYLPQS
jgi:hypothetical protein